MKINHLIRLLLWHCLTTRIPGEPPYYGRKLLLIPAHKPPSIEVAERRYKELEAAARNLDVHQEKNIAQCPEMGVAAYRDWAHQARLDMHAIHVERDYLCRYMRQYYQKRGIKHKLGHAHENALFIFAIELTLGIRYATMHADKFPPQSVDAAKRRISYLKNQESRGLAWILQQIEARGKRRCSRRQITEAQKHTLKIRRAVHAEICMLERWLAAQE